MKYYKIIGLLACTVLIISCFLPWAYYPDVQKSFSGFFSEQNMYGKPGKIFVGMAIISALFILLNKIWAKRIFIFVAAINIAYLLKTYLLFTTCYLTICPEKQYGLYLLIASSILLMVVAVLPDMKLVEKNGDN